VGKYYVRVEAVGDPTIHSPNCFFEVVGSYWGLIFLILALSLILCFAIVYAMRKIKYKEKLNG
jgi:hypothetical protein